MSAKASTRSWTVRVFKHWGFEMILNHAIKSADRICVPTDFVKNDVQSFYPKSASKIVVTGEGVKVLLVSDTDAGLPDKYLLYVGSAYPHKRLDLLLSAWEKLLIDYKDFDLVIVGEKDVFMKKLEDRSKAMQLKRVHFLGRVSDEQLVRIYTQATILVFPSSFEGFGLPPAEALIYGCPVVTSDAGSIPEVLGKNGVVYFKSGELDGMIEAIKTVVDNLEFFKQQASKGAQEIKERHTWERAAIKTRQVYLQTLKL